MDRRLIIDGNAVYELDEKCMLKRHLGEEEKNGLKNERKGHQSGGSEFADGMSGSYKTGNYKMKRTE